MAGGSVAGGCSRRGISLAPCLGGEGFEASFVACCFGSLGAGSSATFGDSFLGADGFEAFGLAAFSEAFGIAAFSEAFGLAALVSFSVPVGGVLAAVFNGFDDGGFFVGSSAGMCWGVWAGLGV